MRNSILGSFILAAAAAFPHAQAYADMFADLTAYDCSGLDLAAAPDAEHLRQVIKGKVNELNAFFTTSGGTRRLKCVTLTRPDARTLSRDEAKAFLAAVTGQSVPAAARAAAVVGAPAPSTLRAEALKAKPAAVGTTSKTAPLAAAKDFTSGTSGVATAAALSAPARMLAPALAAATVSSTARSRVADTKINPWKGVGALQVTFPNGEVVRCTGSLISEYAVLTAGSCIHNAARGGYATAITFTPGQYEAAPGDGKPIAPFGSKSDVASLRTTQRWTEISGQSTFTATDQAYNMGAVLFRTPYRVPGVQMGGLGIYSLMPNSQWGNDVNFTGYPSSVDGKASAGQYTGSGVQTQDSALKYKGITHTTEYAMPATAGDVGAPMIIDTGMMGSAALTGIVTYGDDSGTAAGGPMIEDSWNGGLVAGWQSWTPPSDPPPTEAVSDLHVGSIFSTSQATSQSYLRFYNAGSAAGHVTVDLKNPASGATIASWTSADIQGGGELQVFIEDLERTAFTSGTKPQNYAMAVKPTFEGYFQHVLWQRADNTLTNLTSCDSGVMNDPKTLVAVHSSALQAGYPSTVVVYNSGDAAADISLGIFDARNGARLSTYHVGVVQPGAQAINNMAAMEQAASPKITPSGGMYHYVVSADTAFTGYLQHIVQNTGDGVLTDMSIMCRLTPKPAS